MSAFDIAGVFFLVVGATQCLTSLGILLAHDFEKRDLGKQSNLWFFYGWFGIVDIAFILFSLVTFKWKRNIGLYLFLFMSFLFYPLWRVDAQPIVYLCYEN